MVYLIIFLSFFFAFLIGIFVFFISRSKARKFLKERLEMKLFLVRMPRMEKEGRELKKEIGISEQFLSALASLGAPFALEVAVPHIGDEIHFYVAVPGKSRDVIVRQIQALWGDASVSEAEDYNIFNYTGAVSGVTIKQKNNQILPISTYQELEADSFLPILGGFSKINEIGEGCAIQYVAMPAPSSAKKNIQRAIESLKKGKKAKEVFNGSTIKFKDFEKAFNGSSKKDDETKIVDDEAVEALKKKVSKQLFNVNVRVFASAPSQFQSDSILEGIITGLSQFSTPERNEFKIVKPRKIQDLVHSFSFRDFNNSDTMLLNSEEFASIFHFPTPFTEVPRIKYLKSREAQPPSNLPKEGILLGESVYRNVHVPVRLTREDRRRHLYVIGQTGTGKSVFINNLSGQDMANGEGICVIDPNGDLFEDILSRVPKNRFEDVVVFDPSDLLRPVGINMLEYDPKFPEQKTFIINELMQIFDTLYDLKTTGGPMFEQYTRNALLLLMDDPSNGFTILEIPRVMSDPAFRKGLLEKCTNIIAKDFWEKEAEKAGGDAALVNMVPYITSKFSTFIANDFMRPILAQSKSTIDFRKIMDEGKILLVNLSKGRLGELNASLLGMIIVGKLTVAAFSRADIPEDKRRDFYLYMDEFQNFTTPSISTILSEARKYKLCLIAAHQFIAQLKEPIRNAVFGNVGSMVAFRVGSDDGEFLEKQFEPVFSSRDLINIDNLNAHAKILINNQVYPPFNIFVPFPPRGDKTILDRMRELSRLKYGRPREDVESEIYKRMKGIN